MSTDEIATLFTEKYEYNNVFSLNVSLKHIEKKCGKIDDCTTNLLIYSRFEDDVKDISYSIKLVHYVVNIMGEREIKLYINGYGPSETLYKNLINYYNLQNHVLLNKEKPAEFSYLSTSRFETFGYSIMEALGEGHRVVIFGGEDGVLTSIYKGLSSVSWIEKNVKKDAAVIIETMTTRISEKEYRVDMAMITDRFHTGNYAKTYEILARRAIAVDRKQPLLIPDQAELDNEIARVKADPREKYKEIRSKLAAIPVLETLVNNRRVVNFAKKVMLKKETVETTEVTEELRDNHYFIESFHGSNFSGDPKYLALGLKKRFPQATFYVSSKNQLVDMEIRNFGFEPIRTGSAKYVTAYNRCKYIIVNGNTLDRLYKNPQQCLIQTWHGFPLKKMVNDLGDLKERELQNGNFIPRMMKWDVLLTSSSINTNFFKSAFSLERNPQLKIIEAGLPKNQYLIENKANKAEIEKIKFKYFYEKKKERKFILYCPTWRAGKRKKTSQIELKRVIEQLPENYEIIVKLHPLESHLRKVYKEMHPRIHCFFNELTDIQELYLIADCLISDYSSALFDFAHTGKAIIVLQEDEENYNKDIGFYFNLEKVTGLVGKCYNEAELVAEIKANRDSQGQTETIVKQLLANDSTQSTADIISHLGIGERE